MDLQPISSLARTATSYLGGAAQQTYSGVANLSSLMGMTQGTSNTYEAMSQYFRAHEISRTSLFECRITDPGTTKLAVSDKMTNPNYYDSWNETSQTKQQTKSTQNTINAKVNNLRFACEGMSIPGRSLQMDHVKYYGIEEAFPYMTTYNNVTLSFYVNDKDFYERTFFDAWFELINPKQQYDFKYREEYVSPCIELIQFNTAGQKLYSVKLRNAFPVDLGALQYSWNYSDYHRMGVSISYTDYEVINYSYGAVAGASESALGTIIGKGINAATAGYTIYNAVKSHNYLYGLSALPNLGMTNVNLSGVIKAVGNKLGM